MRGGGTANAATTVPPAHAHNQPPPPAATPPKDAGATEKTEGGSHVLGILFDIDALGGGYYMYAAYKILFRHLDPARLAGCSFKDGDTPETLARRARQYCVAVAGANASQVQYIKQTLAACGAPGLLPGDARFLAGDAVSRFPLVASGEVDSAGRMVVPGGGIGSGWVKDTPWTVVKREQRG